MVYEIKVIKGRSSPFRTVDDVEIEIKDGILWAVGYWSDEAPGKIKRRGFPLFNVSDIEDVSYDYNVERVKRESVRDESGEEGISDGDEFRGKFKQFDFPKINRPEVTNVDPKIQEIKRKSMERIEKRIMESMNRKKEESLKIDSEKKD